MTLLVMSTRLLENLAWVIPALPCAAFLYTWRQYTSRWWAEYLIVPLMLLSVLVGLGTIAWLLVLRRRGGIRLGEAKVVCGLALAAVDVILPVGVALVVLVLYILLTRDGGKLTF